MIDFLIIRLSSLGDIIHTLPAFSVLRHTFPEAQIYWASEKPGKEILEFVPGIDQILVVSNFMGQGLRIRKKVKVAIDFQGLLKSALLAFLAGAKQRLGFNQKNLREPLARFFYTREAAAMDEFQGHVIYKNLALLELLGIKIGRATIPFDFPLIIPQEIKEKVKAKLSASGLIPGNPLLIFNVGAAWPSKRLSAPSWIEVISGVKEKLKKPVNFFILWGNEEELNLAEAVKAQTSTPLLPFLNLKEVIALISLTSLLISGDTFALQVASALSIPSVGLFGPTSPIRNGPFRPQDTIVYAGVNCSPCYRRTCPRPLCWQVLLPAEISETIIRQAEQYV